MAKETITHACGHTSERNLVGPSRDRDWRRNMLSEQLCFECYRQSQSEIAVATKAEYDLPEMGGTPKQIEWAERIRAHWVTDIERDRSATFLRILHDRSSYADAELASKTMAEHGLTGPEVTDRAAQAIFPLLYEHAGRQPAAWWIDHQDRHTAGLAPLLGPLPRIALFAAAANDDAAAAVATALQEAEAQRAREAEIEHAAKLRREQAAIAKQAKIVEALLRPAADLITAQYATVTPHAASVTASFPEYNQTFNDVVRAMRFTFNRPTWRLDTTSPADRAVEIAHRLLGAGFPVRLDDEALRTRVLNADYQPTNGRLVRVNDALTHFVITLPYRDQAESAFRHISGARWNTQVKGVTIPVRQWEAVMDVAKRFKCSLSKRTTAIYEQQRNAILGAPKCETAPKQLPNPAPEMGADDAPVPAHLIDEDEPEFAGVSR